MEGRRGKNYGGEWLYIALFRRHICSRCCNVYGMRDTYADERGTRETHVLPETIFIPPGSRGESL